MGVRREEPSPLCLLPSQPRKGTSRKLFHPLLTQASHLEKKLPAPVHAAAIAAFCLVCNVHCLVATDLDLHSGIPFLLLSGKKRSSVAPDAVGYTRRDHGFEWGKFLDNWNEERSRSPQEIFRGKELEASKFQRVDVGVDRESYVQSLSNNSGFTTQGYSPPQGHLHTQPQLVFSSQPEEEYNTLEPSRNKSL
ncbi:hypothetical protein Taro_011453 [Colocasia esculenta]|uniref:Uncharacterized protein n=1 Tax=Colocasia esculenta TaxID=4460 RepID=A0A843U673_COLES|nr:hypothetical protein [Colocasia esculenta]